MASGAASQSSARWRPVTGHRSRLARRAPSRVQTAERTVAPSRPIASTQQRGEVVLEVQDLKTYFFTYDGVVRALDGVNLTVRRGETTGLVGETGCGKSVTAFSVARLVSEPGRVMSGKIVFRGANLLWGLEKEAKYRRVSKSNRVKVSRSFRRIKAANERLASVRGRGIAMIFQEPSAAMNPVFSIWDQVGEALLLHRGIEIVDGLLAADRAWGESRGLLGSDVEYNTGASETAHTGGGHAATTGAIDALVHAALAGDQIETRAAADRLGETVSLPTLAPEAFYTVRNMGMDAELLRRRVVRSLRRVPLARIQRNYLRFRRRQMVLDAELGQVSFREMKTGKPLRFQRRAIQLRKLRSRLRGSYFRFWGIRRRVERPLKEETFWRVVQALEGVRIANPVQIARGYPHELSGGMLQRVMISMALSCEPEVLLADEPTTALDVTIQAQILELMRQLRERVGTAIVLITHDLGVVAEVCDHVNVMYAGLIVESAPVGELFRRPLHPYTQGLLGSIPRYDHPEKELTSIPGSVPNLISPPPGCRFHPRCPYAMPICKERRPESLPQGEDHTVSCFLYESPAEPAPAEPPTAPSEPSTGEPNASLPRGVPRPV